LNEYAGPIVAHLPISILIVGRDITISFVNDHFLKSMGKTGDQVVGRGLEEVFGRQLVHKVGFEEKIQQFFRTQGGRSLERFQWRGKFYDYCILPMKEPPGLGDNAMLLIEDVTEKVYLEDQLCHSEKMFAIGRLTASVAHEINNPLSIILSNVQYFLSEWGAIDSKSQPSIDLLEALQVIEGETHRCREIVAHLLEFSHKGVSSYEKEEVDLNEVLRKAIRMFERPLQSMNIELIIELSERLPRIRGNANRLQQVFVNLLSNARDAMPKGGKLYIYSFREGFEWVHIGVRDSGAGIAQRHLSKVFEPFFTTKKVGHGTGLGLSVAHSIVEDHGGNLRVESQEGRGATFTIALPIPPKKTVGRLINKRSPTPEHSPNAPL
jgi:signal transduction histidine kinase